MRRTLAIVTLAGLLAVSCGKQEIRVGTYQASPAYTELRAALDSCTITGSAIKLARIFMDKYPDDVALQVLASSLRYDLTASEQEAYYRARAEKDPGNVVAQYLAGRVTSDAEQGAKFANAILSRKPDSYWGHLLLGRALTSKEDLSDADFAQAEKELKHAIALDNTQPYAVESLGYLYTQHGDSIRADKIYARLCEMDPSQFEHLRLRLELTPDNDDRNLALVNQFLKKNPRDMGALAQKADIAYRMHDWNEYRETLRQALDVKRDSVYAYDIACSFAMEKQPDSSFAWLARAVEWGYGDVDDACDDPDLENVRDDPRWDDLKKQMADQHTLQIAGMSRREVAEAAQQRADWAALGLPETAPDFKIASLSGDSVSLASLRGKVVVLDFWATWCYWCHRASPLIDDFNATVDTNRVIVYGVNVMEHDVTPAVLNAFQMQRGIHFPTLLGNEDLTNRYKVVGLPSVFVIDPRGKFAYRAYGYSPALGETLKAIAAEYSSGSGKNQANGAAQASQLEERRSD
jgi:thiol-disulfide isomerase/thioredoxin/Flp pilus assembly protein TadD